MSEKKEITNNEQSQGEFLLYTSADGKQEIQVRLIDETVWLSQKMMAEMFQKETNTIGEHIKNIFAENELQEDFSTTRKYRVVQQEGDREISREIKFYSLDGLLSLNEMEILTHKGNITKALAEKKAKIEFKKYDSKRKELETIEAEEEFIKEVNELKKFGTNKSNET